MPEGRAPGAARRGPLFVVLHGGQRTGVEESVDVIAARPGAAHAGSV